MWQYQTKSSNYQTNQSRYSCHTNDHLQYYAKEKYNYHSKEVTTE